MQTNYRKQFVCDSWQMSQLQFGALVEQMGQRDTPVHEKLLCHIQLWISLNRLVHSGKLAADQVEITRKNATNIFLGIGILLNKLHQYRWTLACHFLVLCEYNSRYCEYDISVCLYSF